MSRDDITLFTDFNIPRAKKPDKTDIKKPIPNETFAIREGDQLKDVSIQEYETTMNDFSQRFLVAAWDENENFVFSPFSLHSVLAMLTTGVTDNSITQLELLQAFGKSQNIQNIEKNYRNLAEQYNNSSIEKILSFGNRLWTTRKYFNKMEQNYLRKIKDLYDADMKFFAKENPENYINDWVKRKTNGRINKIIGNYLCLKLLSKHGFINHLILASFNEQLIMIVIEERFCLKIEHSVSKLYKVANHKTSPFTPRPVHTFRPEPQIKQTKRYRIL